MKATSGRWTACALAATVVMLTSGRAPAQQREEGRPADAAKASRTPERVSGVILKVEPIRRGVSSNSSTEKQKPSRGDGPKTLRLTINTAAIWSDWARDQVSINSAESPKKAAEQGAKSVGTRGEPADEDTVTVVHLEPRSKVETRFRTLQDETSKGASTPAEARRDVEGGTKPSRAGKDKDKPVQFKAKDLRPGLFVEIDFKPMKAGNLATTVTVIRPVTEPLETPSGGK